jgi:RNA polymerase sigma-70 factor (ECF subfamily)
MGRVDCGLRQVGSPTDVVVAGEFREMLPSEHDDPGMVRACELGGDLSLLAFSPAHVWFLVLPRPIIGCSADVPRTGGRVNARYGVSAASARSRTLHTSLAEEQLMGTTDLKHGPAAVDDRERTDLRSDAGLRRAWLTYGPELRRFASANLRDSNRAEDIVQETFLRAWRNADRFDPARGTMRGWLFGILRNVLIDAARARAVRPMVTSSHADAVAPDETDARLSALVIADALRELTDEHREVVIASYVHGRPHREIAASLRVPVGTVRSRLFYARKAIAAQWGDATEDVRS